MSKSKSHQTVLTATSRHTQTHRKTGTIYGDKKNIKPGDPQQSYPLSSSRRLRKQYTPFHQHANPHPPHPHHPAQKPHTPRPTTTKKFATQAHYHPPSTRIPLTDPPKNHPRTKPRQKPATPTPAVRHPRQEIDQHETPRIPQGPSAARIITPPPGTPTTKKPITRGDHPPGRWYRHPPQPLFAQGPPHPEVQVKQPRGKQAPANKPPDPATPWGGRRASVDGFPREKPPRISRPFLRSGCLKHTSPGHRMVSGACAVEVVLRSTGFDVPAVSGARCRRHGLWITCRLPRLL